jgi:hypothetical protein
MALPTGQNHLHQHALLDLMASGENVSDGASEVDGLNLGEIAELSKIHAQYRHWSTGEEVDRPQHRSIAAKGNHEIHIGERTYGLDRSPLSCDQVSVRPTRHDTVSLPGKPVRNVTASGHRLGTGVVHGQRDHRHEPPTS